MSDKAQHNPVKEKGRQQESATPVPGMLPEPQPRRSERHSKPTAKAIENGASRTASTSQDPDAGRRDDPPITRAGSRRKKAGEEAERSATNRTTPAAATPSAGESAPTHIRPEPSSSDATALPSKNMRPATTQTQPKKSAAPYKPPPDKAKTAAAPAPGIENATPLTETSTKPKKKRIRIRKPAVPKAAAQPAQHTDNAPALPPITLPVTAQDEDEEDDLALLAWLESSEGKAAINNSMPSRLSTRPSEVRTRRWMPTLQPQQQHPFAASSSSTTLVHSLPPITPSLGAFHASTDPEAPPINQWLHGMFGPNGTTPIQIALPGTLYVPPGLTEADMQYIDEGSARLLSRQTNPSYAALDPHVSANPSGSAQVYGLAADAARWEPTPGAPADIVRSRTPTHALRYLTGDRNSSGQLLYETVKVSPSDPHRDGPRTRLPVHHIREPALGFEQIFKPDALRHDSLTQTLMPTLSAAEIMDRPIGGQPRYSPLDFLPQPPGPIYSPPAPAPAPRSAQPGSKESPELDKQKGAGLVTAKAMEDAVLNLGLSGLGK